MRLPWLSGTIALTLLGGLAWYLAPLNPGVLALQLAFTPRAFGNIIHLWSAQDLARYRAHLPVDFGLILAYSVFGYSLARRTRVFSGLTRFWSAFARWCLPVAGALTQWRTCCMRGSRRCRGLACPWCMRCPLRVR